MTMSKSTTTAELIEQYNFAAAKLGRDAVKRFADRATAEKRTAAILAELAAAKVKPAKVAAAKVASAPKKSAPAKVSTGGGIGVGSAFAGRKLFPAVATNPRRPDSFGFRSLSLIFAKPGLTYEQFIAAGGRSVDLRWDVSHGNAKVGE
jgi:hypothetical protein